MYGYKRTYSQQLTRHKASIKLQLIPHDLEFGICEYSNIAEAALACCFGFISSGPRQTLDLLQVASALLADEGQLQGAPVEHVGGGLAYRAQGQAVHPPQGGERHRRRAARACTAPP